MLIEGAILVKQLVDVWNRPDWQFPPCPAGSELGVGERYIVFATWPDWGPLAKTNPPAASVLSDELSWLGCDAAFLIEADRGFALLLEVHVAGVNVKDVQGVFARHGGLAVVCYTAGAVDWVSEVSWDALEVYQEAVDDIHDMDPVWWTKTVATVALVVVLVLGGIFVTVALLKMRKGSK